MAIFGGTLLPKALGDEAKIDFAESIRPILLQSCIECHGPEKQKGKLRLDRKSEAFREATTIVSGKAAESELYQRIILPPDHDDIMPAKGDPLTQKQTDLIRDWIDQGASWPDDLTIGLPAQPSPEPSAPIPLQPSPDEGQAIAQLRTLGVQVRPVAQNGPWTTANLRTVDSNNLAQAMVLLAKVLTLQDLNLAGIANKHDHLGHIAGLTNLVRLHLEKTPITDAGLVHLKNFVHLQYLNLYQTKVTDAGLDHLQNLKQLRNLFLWQTEVTPAGIDKLQASLAKTDISLGWTTAQPKASASDSGQGKKQDPGEPKQEKKED